MNGVFLIDDDDDLRIAHLQSLRLAGLEVHGFDAAEPALSRLDASFDGIVVSDVRMPGMDGLTLAARIRTIDPDLPVILITGHGDIEMAVRALQDGAFDFLAKPFASDRLVAAVRMALRHRALVIENRRLSEMVAREETQGPGDGGLLGQSAAIDRVRAIIRAVAPGDVDLLIEGDSGVGKEVAARMLHRLSRRARRPFVVINCAALPPQAFEVELFGRAMSASGHGRRTGGRAREAGGGTLVIDEIDALDLPLQARLLRLIEDRELPQDGGVDEPVDLRIVATTRQDLEAAVRDGRFRADLYYRLSAVTLKLPPMRERVGDVELLFRHFVTASAARQRVAIPAITAPVMTYLAGHDWPGNVRELEQYAERHVLGLTAATAGDASDEARQSLAERVAAFEARTLAAVLSEVSGDVQAALDHLQIPRKTFYDKVKRHGLNLDRFRTDRIRRPS